MSTPSTIHPISPPGQPSSSETSHIRKVSRTKEKKFRAHDKGHRRATTIGMLPDDVLLEIFYFYRLIPVFTGRYLALSWPWHLLVHVCRRWREIIFESPHRLDLRIGCTHKTPVKKNLRIWPNFPISIHYDDSKRSLIDNAIDALRLSDRVGHVKLSTSSMLEEMVKVMQEPFPVLTHIDVVSTGDGEGLPGGFLGGSAPRLLKVFLYNISFPALPILLSSTSNLISLSLFSVPPAGYISPDAMIACLVALPRLETLDIRFQEPTPLPSQIRPPPETRIVLPTLTSFTFYAAREYLEDIAAQIDCPQLEVFYANCLNPLADAPIVQIPKFVDRSVGRKSTLFRHAQVFLSYDSFCFDIFRREPHPFWAFFPSHRNGNMTIKRSIIKYDGIGRQISNTTQAINRFSARLSDVVHLELEAEAKEVCLSESNAEWLHLLRQFPAAQTLRVSRALTGYIALALEDVTEMASDVLPLLKLICLDAKRVPSIEKFVAVRQLSGRPVTIVGTMTEFRERLKSYISE